jgi:hypothetical protein
MKNEEKFLILEKAKAFFADKIIGNHLRGIKTLTSHSEFNINPFIQPYLAKLLCGEISDASIARSLIYPRVLAHSISGIFGSQMQNFCSEVLEGFGSTTLGIDIEFIDQTDKRKKYCQLKAGPNTLNKDDVDTILAKFNAVKNLARTNNLKIEQGDLVVGVLYGSEAELSSHYKKIRNKHFIPVLVGYDFWCRLTGDNQFFQDLILAFQEVSKEHDAGGVLEDAILELSKALKTKKLII